MPPLHRLAIQGRTVTIYEKVLGTHTILSRLNVYFLALITMLTALLLRISEREYFTNSLWAEDGTIFINQALESGLDSLFIPYAGYLHLYPRLAAYVAVQLPAIITPYLFLLFWLLCAAALALVISRKAIDLGLDYRGICIIVLLVMMQPTSGEVYYNLTNVQWFTGAALMIYALIQKGFNESRNPESRISGSLKYPFILLTGLTGPFSVLSIPLLVMRAYIFRDFKKHYQTYVLILGTACVQFFMIISSDRVGQITIDTVIRHWLKAIYVFFAFGAGNRYVVAISVIFWILVLVSVINSLVSGLRKRLASEYLMTAAFIAAFIAYAAGLFAVRQTPDAINPMANGARYFFVPYTLLVVALMSNSVRGRIPVVLALACFTLICAFSFVRFHRSNLQYQSYARLAMALPGIQIPLNPVWPVYPGWFAVASADSRETYISKSQINIMEDNLIVLGGTMKKANSRSTLFDATSNDFQIYFTDPVVCAKGDHLAFMFDVTRDNPGWAQLFWSESGAYNERQSLRRYFNAGKVTMSFAFRYSEGGLYVRFDPTETIESITVNKIEYYCLD